GPWHVRQVRNPWAPGMRFDTLLALIKRGQVTRESIVRGPTTYQLWKRASEIKGLSREFGLCYSCGAEINTQANVCPGCNRLQEPPVNPDVLVETEDIAARERPVPAPVPAPAPAPVRNSTLVGGAMNGIPALPAHPARPASPAPLPAPVPAASEDPPAIEI